MTSITLDDSFRTLLGRLDAIVPVRGEAGQLVGAYLSQKLLDTLFQAWVSSQAANLKRGSDGNPESAEVQIGVKEGVERGELTSDNNFDVLTTLYPHWDQSVPKS